MRLRILLLAVLPVLAVSLTAQTGSPGLYTRNNSALWVPVEVKTPDGIALPAGEYTVTLRRAMLVPVSPPFITLGYITGPTLLLTRLNAPPDSGAIRRYGSRLAPTMLELATVGEVRAVFDMPARPLDPHFAFYGTAPVAPLIRGRVFEGIMFGDQLLRIVGTSGTLRVPGRFLPALPKPK